jgi:hypothetical protein
MMALILGDAPASALKMTITMSPRDGGQIAEINALRRDLGFKRWQN